jgi:hypothetical protein
VRAHRLAGLGVLAAAFALAGCGSSVPTAHPLGARPSLELSVPLTVAACDDTNQCYALGTTGFADAAAQVFTPWTRWRALTSPAASDTVLTSAACWSNGCLFGGASPDGDVLWRAEGARPLVPVAGPTGGAGVVALSCFGDGTCAVVDTDALGTDRLSFTTDAGSLWGTPSSVGVDIVRSLACTSTTDCVVAGVNDARPRTAGTDSVAVVSRTVDGGASWQASTTPASWASLDSLACAGTDCVARATSAVPSSCTGPACLTPTENAAVSVVRSSNLGATWTPLAHQPAGRLSALACAGPTQCLGVTTNSHEVTRVTTWRHGRWRSRAVRYLPGLVAGVSCASTRCVVATSSAVLVADWASL